MSDEPGDLAVEDQRPAEAKRGGWGWGTWVFVVALGILMTMLVFPWGSRVSPKANQMKATSNCRQIIMAMKAYAADYGGEYPRGKTANEAFRELLKADILQDERLFGCPLSPFVPDGEIGPAPDFPKAVGPGENHWMLVDGQTDTSPAWTPLVFENALDNSWPPVWDGSPYDKVRKRGQTWKGSKIIVGLNDNSVSIEKLAGKDLRRQTFGPGSGDKSITDLLPHAVVLDIEE